MIDPPYFLAVAQLDARTLESWVTAGWLKPSRSPAGWRFSEADLRRARLVRDLQQTLGSNDQAVTALLDLIDQTRNVQRMLRALLSVARALPEPVQRCIAVNRVAPDAESRRARAGAGRRVSRSGRDAIA
jgi:chaperone modulatory protein CbpM